MKILKWVQLALVLVLVVAACGGDDDNKDDEGQSATTPIDGSSSDGSVSVSTEPVVQLHDLGNGQTREMVLSPDGAAFFVATESAITRVSLVDDREETVEVGLMRNLVVTADGKRLAGYSEAEHTVMMCDVEADTTSGLHGLETAIHLAFSPDGSQLVGVAIGEPTVLVMWSVESGDVMWTIERDASASTAGGASAAFSPDGQTVAVGLYDGSVSLRDAQTGEVVQRFAGHTATNTGADVVSVAFAPNGSTIATVGQDNKVRVWNVETGAARQAIDAWEATLAYTPDSQWIIAMRITRANSARTWNVATGQLGQVFDGPVQMMPDGSKVYGGIRAQNITIFDFQNGHHLVSFDHIKASQINVPHPDSQSMFSTYWEEPVIYQWDVTTGEEIKRWEWEMDSE